MEVTLRDQAAIRLMKDRGYDVKFNVGPNQPTEVVVSKGEEVVCAHSVMVAFELWLGLPSVQNVILIPR